MRILLLIFFAFLLSPLRAAAPIHAWERWEGCTLAADQYFDGDSFHVKFGKKTQVVRLYGADAPETDKGLGTRIAEQAAYFGVTVPEVLHAGEAAKEFTEKFLSQPFTVITCRKVAPGASRSERIYAMIDRGGVGLDEALIQAGLARIAKEVADYPDAAAGQLHEQHLRALEQKAAQDRKGLWAKSQRTDRRASWKDLLTPRILKPNTLPTPHKVNLNTASATDLEALPGIGPKTAEKIIRARPLKDINALDAVPGIGPKKLEALRGLVSFERDSHCPDLRVDALALAMNEPNQTLVLGTAFAYSPAQVRVFVESLRLYYDGEIQLLVTSQGPPELVEYLRHWKVTPRLFDCAPWMVTHIQLGRYVRYYELLLESSVRYDRILLTDVSDVLFQAHPFAGAPEGRLLFFMEDSRASIGSCPMNSLWMRHIFGEQILAQLASRQISCSGTTIGSHEAILQYIETVLRYASPKRMAQLQQWRGHDQGIHNFLLHTGALPEISAVPNGVWVHTLAQVPDAEVVVREGGIYTLAGQRCPIVHQWNYRPTVAAWMIKHWGR